MSDRDPVTLAGMEIQKLLDGDTQGQMDDLIDPVARAIYERLVAVQDRQMPWDQMSEPERRPYHDAAGAALRPVLLWALRQVMGRVRQA